MKKAIVFTLLSLSLPALANIVFHPGPDWEEVKQNVATKAWKFKGGSQAVVVLIEHEAESEVTLTREDLSEQVSKKEMDRARMLSGLGITDWTIKKSDIASFKGGQVFKYQGHYKKNEEWTEFVEETIYMGKKRFKIQFSQPEENRRLDDADIKKLFTMVRMEK